MSYIYGINESNSNRADSKHSTKNCFNSSFPAALGCYMLEKDIPAIYAKIDVDKNSKNIDVHCSTIKMNRVFNSSKLAPNKLYFDFESKFEPYSVFAADKLEKIDLVVRKNDDDREALAPLEIKLTTLPCSSTANLPEKQWGCEIVVRPATTIYIALGLWSRVKNKKEEVRKIFDKTCKSIKVWNSSTEVAIETENICNALDTFEKTFIKFQSPLVLEPIWKTDGQSYVLNDDLCDMIVWSDMAFSRLFIDKAREHAISQQNLNPNGMKVTRPMRAAIQMAHCLWELSKADNVEIQDIYTAISYNKQSDKSFMALGKDWRSYIDSKYIDHPRITKDVVINEILSDELIGDLKPERRFDESLILNNLATKLEENTVNNA